MQGIVLNDLGFSASDNRYVLITALFLRQFVDCAQNFGIKVFLIIVYVCLEKTLRLVDVTVYFNEILLVKSCFRNGVPLS